MKNNFKNLFYAGTSGLVVPVKKEFYPPEFQGKSRLTYYSSLFNSIEINSSFYKTPMAATVARWSESVPGNFKFTFKLSKAITHSKKLEFDVLLLELFFNTINQIGDKKGCLLIQLPPGVKMEQFDKVEKLLSQVYQLNPDNSWKVAIEFRHTSWHQPEVDHLLKNYRTALVVQDLPASSTPLSAIVGPFHYIRFHGPVPGYRGSYSDDLLKKTAKKINELIEKGSQVFCYFNNTMGDAVKNLQTLNNFLK
jgi:uncharacterized protein YecE (DUF72 family)